jgi:hypothetical protein
MGMLLVSCASLNSVFMYDVILCPFLLLRTARVYRLQNVRIKDVRIYFGAYCGIRSNRILTAFLVYWRLRRVRGVTVGGGGQNKAKCLVGRALRTPSGFRSN